MRRSDRQFMRNMIILAVTGLSLLMVILFVALSTFLSKPGKGSTYTKEKEEMIEQPVELSETLTVLIENITDTHINGYDIHNKKAFDKLIMDTVKVSDAYGNVLPISQLKVGDIIEVNYKSEQDKIISINKSPTAINLSNITGIMVDAETKQMNIAGATYGYTNHTLVVDQDGLPVDIEQIGTFDVASLQIIDNTVWSIVVNEASASLILLDLPTSNGQIEIDNSRLIMFKDVKEPIKLTPGKHKIVIKMKGYTTIVESEFMVEAGETYELSLKEAEIAYTEIVQRISPSNVDYTITIGGKEYKRGDTIKLQQDEYVVVVAAEGYYRYAKKIKLEQDTFLLRVSLQAIEEETEEEETLETESNSAKEEESTGARTITINSDPQGADIYIDGERKGKTPYTTTLNNGTYRILLEKTDYEIYSADILLDGSNNQNTYLYQMSLKEKDEVEE